MNPTTIFLSWVYQLWLMLAMTYSRYAGCYSEQTNGWSTHTTQINKYLHNIFNNTVILEIGEGSHFNLAFLAFLTVKATVYMAEILPIRHKTLSNQSINWQLRSSDILLTLLTGNVIFLTWSKQRVTPFPCLFKKP